MENFSIQAYDIIMLVVLILAAVFGAWKGIAWQVASMSSLVVSYVVAVRFSGGLAPYISDSEPWNRFLAMLILFVITSLGIWIVFRMVAGLIDRVRLREFDRQMGALFGLAKGFLLCLVITFFAVTLTESSRQAVLKSRSGYYIALMIQRGGPLLPEDAREVVGEYIDALDRRLDPDTTPIERASDTDEPASESPEDDRPPAWDPELWRHDAGHLLDEKADELGRSLDESLDRSRDRIGEHLGSGLDRL